MPADDPPPRPPADAGGDAVLATERAAGVIAFDRAQAAQGLSAVARAAIADSLRRWARDPEIYAVIMRSATAVAFCGGGGERELAAWGRAAVARARASLGDAYALLWRMECFTKPTITLIDGKAAGLLGALCLYGTHRVAGESYRFAMPEVGFGYFPGHGLAGLLKRLPVGIGMYLALTGRGIGRADAYRLGLVTHCVAATRFDAIGRAIADAEPVDLLLDACHEDPGGGELEALAAPIAHCFVADTPEEIITRLGSQSEHRAWAQGVVADLMRASPTSLKIAHRRLREAHAGDVRAALLADFRVACRVVEGRDFYAGVRARFEGGEPPQWRPGRLEEVRKEDVEAFFAGLGADELKLASRAEMQAFRA
jgi:enoyl-CoA hydratase